jgi:hypothetical protein
MASLRLLRVPNAAENRDLVSLARRGPGNGRRSGVSRLRSACLTTRLIPQVESPEDGVPESSHYSRRLSSNISQTGEDPHPTVDRDRTPGTYASEHHGSARTASRSYSPESRHSRNQSNSALANSMMRTVVSSGNDALNILFEAAAAHSQENGLTEGAQTRNAHNHTDDTTRHESSLNQIHSTVAPEVLAKAIQPVELSHVTKEVLSVWEMCRFVRMGWFTSREAVTFIDLYVRIGMVTLRPPTNLRTDSTKTCHLCRPFLQISTPITRTTTGL